MKNYTYLTNCVSSTAGKIDDMIDLAREIKYEAFVRNVGMEEIYQIFPFYENCGLKLKNDWHVRYFRSKYMGKKCVYMVHSAIEYIFVETNKKEFNYE